jgi:hypothetical protein
MDSLRAIAGPRRLKYALLATADLRHGLPPPKQLLGSCHHEEWFDPESSPELFERR